MKKILLLSLLSLTIFLSQAIKEKKVDQKSFKNFYLKTPTQRLITVQKYTNLDEQKGTLLKKSQHKWAQTMVENMVGTIPIPVGIAPYFLVNGKEYIVPMATEEASVIAGACKAAKLARNLGGFIAQADNALMTGHIQLTNIPDINAAQIYIAQNQENLLAHVNTVNTELVHLGGGAKSLQTKVINTERGTMLILELTVNVVDAMGANIVNSMLEHLAPVLEKTFSCKSVLKIISNLAVHRMVKATAVWSLDKQIIEKILDAQAFARADITRTVTHNKGIMNGIDAVALATGNDWRALEAGAHAYAAQTGVYQPLTSYTRETDNTLRGTIQLPLAVGIVGGATHKNPFAQIHLQILNVTSAQELSCVMASVGLAQNFAALLAMVTTGIQAAHMPLHQRGSLQAKFHKHASLHQTR